MDHAINGLERQYGRLPAILVCLGALSCWSLGQAHRTCEEEKDFVCPYFQVDDSLERASQPHTKELKSVIREVRGCCG